MTVQVFIDTVLLARHDPREMAATFPAVMWFWLPFSLLQVTAGYTSTFVAQYTGAGRPHRVGPAVWQGLHFAVACRAADAPARPGRPAGHLAGRTYRHPPVVGGGLPAVPGVRRFADAGHGGRQRVLLRPRPNLDRPRRRGGRHGGQRRAGPRPDLRASRLSGDGDRGRGVGDRRRGVGVRPDGRGSAAEGRVIGSVSPRHRGGARSGSCSLGY